MSEEKRRILEMLEEGTITQEDAQRLLAALGEPGESGVSPEETFAPAEEPSAASHSADEGEEEDEEDQDDEGGEKAFVPDISQHLLPVFLEGGGWEGVRSMEIEWVAGEVEIIPWEGTKLRVTETANRPMKDGEQMGLTVKNGLLQVAWVRKHIRFGVNHLSKHLLVEVPAGQGLDSLTVDSVSAGVRFESVPTLELKLSCVSGGLYARGASGKKVELSTVSGELEADGFAGDRVKLTSVSGKVTGHGAAEEVHGETVSGKIDLALEDLPRSVHTESISGKTALTLPANALGFSVKYESMSGQMESDFPLTGELKKHSGNGACGDGGSCRIKMETVSGKMRLLRGQ